MPQNINKENYFWEKQVKIISNLICGKFFTSIMAVLGWRQKSQGQIIEIWFWWTGPLNTSAVFGVLCHSDLSWNCYHDVSQLNIKNCSAAHKIWTHHIVLLFRMLFIVSQAGVFLFLHAVGRLTYWAGPDETEMKRDRGCNRIILPMLLITSGACLHTHTPHLEQH